MDYSLHSGGSFSPKLNPFVESIQVIHEDNHLIAVNKPPGWLVQADETGDDTLADWVKAYIKLRYEKPGDVFLGVIHRIDRPASGAVVFARTSKALSRMNALFKEREIEKVYLAVVAERPQPLAGQLVHYIAKDSRRNVAKAYSSLNNRAKEAGARKATLDYELIGELEGRHLLRIQLHTGRPHQIRVQLGAIGCPILGDVKYGFKQPNRDGSIHLHCLAMGFVHPVRKEPLLIRAQPPEGDPVWRLFANLIPPA
jgi:23S rRNA pseudouridine1911/1915/1917 synthase